MSSHENMPTRTVTRALLLRRALVIVPVAYVFAFFVAPVVVEFLSSVRFPDLTLGEYAKFDDGPAVRRAMLNSLAIAFQSSVLAALLGLVLLSGLAVWGGMVRAVVIAALLIPFAASELVRIVSWVLVLGPNGPVSRALETVFDSAPTLIGNRTGVLIGLVHVELPFFVLSALPTVLAVRPEYVRAAASMGANRCQRLLSVTLPLCLPGILAAWALAFILGLAYYATPTLLGGTNEQTTLPSLIMSSMFTTADWNQAAAQGMLLLGLAVVGCFVVARLGGLKVLYSGAASGRPSPRRRRFAALGSVVYSTPFQRLSSVFDRVPVRVALIGLRGLLTAGILLFLITPALAAVPASLGSSTLIQLVPDELSLRWYAELFQDPAWAAALMTSATVSIAAALLATAIGLCAAIVLVKGWVRHQSAYFTLLLLPMIMPLPVIALGLFLVMEHVGLAFTWGSLLIGYTLFALPYAVIVLTTGLQSFDWTLDTAAQSLGARPLERLRDIWVPMLRPTFIVSILFCFIIAFTELVFALFMRTTDLTTLPVKMWTGLRYNLDPTAAAVSGLTFMLTIVVLVVGYAWRSVSRRTR